ncbi:unnamed protein product [Meloidogyne enterolobii]|uniref:Uncharacterized protein n=1 Tax=Meloidogyne enterolobii TaxID=390850 RepID=A0ACB1AX24_MELEN
MFFPKFIFFKFLIFIGITNVNSLFVKFKFNLKFKCGDELANGRLMVNYRKSMYSGVSTYIFKIVIIGGIVNYRRLGLSLGSRPSHTFLVV